MGGPAVRFTFSRSAESGLPVIPLIPNYRLSTIEGRNGIGKTLAARILEFVSGEQPFITLPKAWESFCDDLGVLTVSIDDFPGGETVRCELDSSNWRGRTEADCVIEPGEVFINGESADWETARALIQVRRIAGDEGLGETLARTLREASLYARGRGRETAAVVDELGAQLGAITDDIVSVRIRGQAEDLELYRSATKAFDAAKTRAEVAATALARANQRLEAHQAVADALSALPPLLADHIAALAAQSRAEAAVGAADREFTDFGRQQAMNAEKQERIDWLVGRLPARIRLLAAARVEEQTVHTFLKIDARLNDLKRHFRIKEVDREIQDLVDENRSADLAGTVRAAQQNIEGELRSMPKAAQHERIATVGRDIRVHELAEGIAARRKQLEGIPKPDEVAERERTVERLRRQGLRLADLSAVYRKTDQKQQLVDEGMDELIALGGTAEEGQAFVDANERATVARTDMLSATVALHEARAAVETAIGLDSQAPAVEADDVDEDDETRDLADVPSLLTEAQLADRVAEWMTRVGQTIDARARPAWDTAVRSASLVIRIEQSHTATVMVLKALSTEAAAARTAHAAAVDALAKNATAHHRAEDAVRSRLDRLANAVRSIQDEAGSWAPYRDTVDAVLRKVGLEPAAFDELAEDAPRPTDLLDDVAPRYASILMATQAVGAIDEIAVEVEAAASRIRDQWSNAANYLYEFSGRLSTRLDDSPFDARSMRAATGDHLLQWAEDTISDLLSSPELRAELFGGSDVIAFNMTDLTVSWTDVLTKKRRRRPIEAFSSGEQVFAYTKAKLELLRSLRQRVAYVVIFLDEFGAFVARDRFAQLVTYIEHDALGSIADQIVITVPLSGTLEQVRDAAALANLKPEIVDPPGYVVVPARTD